MEEYCLKGAKEICVAVGENPKNMHELVNDHGLPAWKRDVNGTWRALPEDLRRWIREQRDRHISSYVFRPKATSRPGAVNGGGDTR